MRVYHACPHLPDPINKRLGEILILGTTASLMAGQPLRDAW